VADCFLCCVRLGYVLLFSDCVQGQMSHFEAADGCGKLVRLSAFGFRRSAFEVQLSGFRHSTLGYLRCRTVGNFSWNGFYHP
jgi:hypothetical protein